MEIEQTISSPAAQKATISYSPAVSSGHHSGERPRWSGHLIRADLCECPLSTEDRVTELKKALISTISYRYGTF